LCIRWRRVYPLAVAYLFLDNSVDHPSRIYMRTKRSRAHIRLSWLDVLLFPPCLLGSGNTTQASVYLVSAMSHNKIVLTAPSQHQEGHPTSAPPTYDDVWAASDPAPQITASLPSPSRFHTQPATITKDEEPEATPPKTPVQFRKTRAGFIIIVVAVVVVLVAAVVGGVVGGLLSRKANLKESSPVVTVGPGPFPGQTSSDLGGGLTAQQSSSSDLGGGPTLAAIPTGPP